MPQSVEPRGRRGPRGSQPAGRAQHAPGVETGPAIFHVSHWKAGTTWLANILRSTAPQRLVRSKPRVGHFLREPIVPGMIYPRVCVTHAQFDRVELPEQWARFVVVRDLRDTLISAYFSVKVSHKQRAPGDAENRLAELRSRLQGLSTEDGMQWFLEAPVVRRSAEIQRSWLDAGEPLIRYEDLLADDVAILERVLIDECGLDVPRARLRRVVDGARFDKAAKGRKPGQEDISSHVRKGIAGDWRNHFTPALTEEFKQRYGDLLIATGYESDLDW